MSNVTVAAKLTPNNLTPMELINIVVKSGSGLDQLGQLAQLHQDYERYEAEKAFNNSMAMFQADPPEIFKNKHVEFGNTKYDHASLDHAVDEIRLKMKEHGLMFTWDIEDLNDGVQRCTCEIRHQLGHSKSTAMSAPPDQTGQKNTVQARASTITYLQRYTLLAATGCAPKHLTPDNDGRPLPTTDAKEKELFFKRVRSLCRAQRLPLADFCKTMKIQKVEDLPPAQWDFAIKKLGDRAKKLAEIQSLSDLNEAAAANDKARSAAKNT